MKASVAGFVCTVGGLIGLGSLIAWLYPTNTPARRRVPISVAEVLQVDKNPKTDTNRPLEPKPLSNAGVLELLDAYSLPSDPDYNKGNADAAHPRTGSEDAVLRQEPEATVEEVLARAPSLIGRGFDRQRLYFNLGRLALAHGDKEAALQFLRVAAEGGSIGAKTYLTQFVGEPIEQLAVLNQAIRAGFVPAGAMKKTLEAKFVNDLDANLLDPNDPQKPSTRVGVTDGALKNMAPTDLEYLIRNYGEWAKSKPDMPRLTFEIGRGAYCLSDYAHAEEYLGIAAKLQSPAAVAYLTLLPSNLDEFDQNLARLQFAVKGKYLPAAKWLADATQNVYDLRHFDGASKVIDAMYRGRTDLLLSGSVFFDYVEVNGLSKELFIRPMLLDYVSEFAGYYEGEEPAYLGAPELALSIVRAGSAEKGRRKVNETFSGLIMNNNYGGGILAIQKVLEGNWGPALRALQPDGGIDASLKQRREQVKQMGKTHARAMFIMAKNGNKDPMKKVYATALEFIDRVQ